jgi:hypothetical protein
MTGPAARRRTASVAVAVALFAALGSACSSGASPGGGSAASFVIDGSRFAVDEGGTINVSVRGVPALNYSGPLGCQGQFFHLAYSPNYDVFFRYTASDAVLAFANDVYHFATPPTRSGGELVWDSRGLDTTGAPHHLTVRVKCPLPATTTKLDAGP